MPRTRPQTCTKRGSGASGSAPCAPPFRHASRRLCAHRTVLARRFVPMTAEPDAALVALLAGWAHGDASAAEDLVSACVARITPLLPDATPAGVEPAVRRLLARAPRFTVSDPHRLLALLRRLLANELEAPARSGGSQAPARSARASAAVDLDAGRTSPDDEARRTALTKLALLLLAPAERKLVQARWAGVESAGDAESGARAAALHQQVLAHLDVGAVDEALAAVGPRTGADPWGSATQWSMVLGAVAAHDTARVQESWRRLVERYRAPITSAIRRATGGSGDAEDLVAEFFSYLFEHQVLAKVRPDAGKLRAYIQAVLRNFLQQRRRRSRGALDLDDVEAPADPGADRAAERADESEWAAHVLRLAIAGMLQRSPRDGDLLLRYYGISWPEPHTPRAPETREALASAAGLSLAALDQATHRARRALRACLERELRETVDGAGAYEAEAELVVARLLEAHPGLL